MHDLSRPIHYSDLVWPDLDLDLLIFPFFLIQEMRFTFETTQCDIGLNLELSTEYLGEKQKYQTFCGWPDRDLIYDLFRNILSML